MEELSGPRPRRVRGIDRPVGPLAFGCWRFVHDDVTTAARVLDTALDHGLTLVDTADVYGLDWGGAGFGAAEALRGACEASLRRLGVDHVDLYQVHRPDLLTAADDVASTLLDLRRRGLIGAIGISNHTPAQHDALAALLGEPLATTQPELSLLATGALRDGTLDRCASSGTVPLAWSPLGGGRLATGENLPPALRETLADLAATHGTTPAAVAIAWVLALPSRPIAIVGSQDPGRIAELATATGVPLRRSEWYRLLEAAEGVPLP